MYVKKNILLKTILFIPVLGALWSCDANLLKIESKNPTWSPKGDLIAFELGHPTIGYQIYIADLNGSQPVPLIPKINQKQGETLSDPAWSPDGRTIAFVAHQLPGASTSGLLVNTGLSKVNVNGTQRVQLSNSVGDQAPAWSPDGKRLTFASQDNSTPAPVASPSTFTTTQDNPTPPADGTTPPAGGTIPPADGITPPAGGTIPPAAPAPIYSIFTINADGSFRQKIQNVTGFDPVWTPNGQRLMYSTGPNIFLINQDGTNQLRFTHFPSAQVKQPAMSPNGQMIAFSADINPTAQPNFQIFIVNAQGLNLQQLTNIGVNTEPAWAPDSSMITFTSDRNGRKEVYTMSINGQHQTRITDSAFFDVYTPPVPLAPQVPLPGPPTS